MDDTTVRLVLVIAGALITALSYYVVKMGIHLKDSVPPEVASVLINLLGDLASRTANTDDDELVQKLAALLETNAVAQPKASQFDGRP